MDCLGKESGSDGKGQVSILAYVSQSLLSGSASTSVKSFLNSGFLVNVPGPRAVK